MIFFFFAINTPSRLRILFYFKTLKLLRSCFFGRTDRATQFSIRNPIKCSHVSNHTHSFREMDAAILGREMFVARFQDSLAKVGRNRPWQTFPTRLIYLYRLFKLAYFTFLLGTQLF